jgi:hypothetical protein
LKRKGAFERYEARIRFCGIPREIRAKGRRRGRERGNNRERARTFLSLLWRRDVYARGMGMRKGI